MVSVKWGELNGKRGWKADSSGLSPGIKDPCTINARLHGRIWIDGMFFPYKFYEFHAIIAFIMIFSCIYFCTKWAIIHDFVHIKSKLSSFLNFTLLAYVLHSVFLKCVD